MKFPNHPCVQYAIIRLKFCASPNSARCQCQRITQFRIARDARCRFSTVYCWVSQRNYCQDSSICHQDNRGSFLSSRGAQSDACGGQNRHPDCANSGVPWIRHSRWKRNRLRLLPGRDISCRLSSTIGRQRAQKPSRGHLLQLIAFPRPAFSPAV